MTDILDPTEIDFLPFFMSFPPKYMPSIYGIPPQTVEYHFFPQTIQDRLLQLLLYRKIYAINFIPNMGLVAYMSCFHDSVALKLEQVQLKKVS